VVILEFIVFSVQFSEKRREKILPSLSSTKTHRSDVAENETSFSAGAHHQGARRPRKTGEEGFEILKLGAGEGKARGQSLCCLHPGDFHTSSSSAVSRESGIDFLIGETAGLRLRCQNTLFPIKKSKISNHHSSIKKPPPLALLAAV
jgi:hypothetical protein